MSVAVIAGRVAVVSLGEVVVPPEVSSARPVSPPKLEKPATIVQGRPGVGAGLEPEVLVVQVVEPGAFVGSPGVARVVVVAWRDEPVEAVAEPGG